MDEYHVNTAEQPDDVIRLAHPFNYEGYQVVRQEFFAHVNEPAVTFNNYKFYGNAACLRKFPDTDFVQVLINRERKLLVLRPCREEERDAFPWRTQSSKKPKQATCRLFEDDGVTYDYETGDFNIVTLEAVDGKVRVARTGDCPLRRYEVAGCEFVD